MDERSVTISLGEMDERAQAFLATGEYESLDDVVQEGLRALERERAVFNAKIKAMVDEALADPRPDLPIEEAFALVRAQIADRRR